ncbi:MAG TPA: beta-carotene ketolase [Cyanobacteria bacterium UBA11149]|nr:beta-carotene ketolase [Cyanobacteria bacterium UBA11367]HBE57710.1 beta-carotene ketolase [Cyanobacteria bacterium UBA11366]HBK65376.1 beta-carotene ketolase [Cyanobacteria bacterium UBA11166]HBR75820.1 beta-carotene ketolase [Cyanobacteria bacterium UBA11159]HBS72317.1 beta-carotene ketolase [Cyanobacteria bacterium UBA11153]HBW91151.1 beta-carotene ketolase [Cyanobacteria bacterium UBA11149]HCA94388.1 beta-carotene ketolase [Cyanobacteria bacterium UBA9226]
MALPAAGIAALGIGSLSFLLPLPLADISLFWLVLAILVRTFLHTGLFIIAHDAMHGSLVPNHKVANDLIGKFAIWLYAFFPYERYRENHWQHHHYPGQIRDPDFHDGIHRHPLRWYLKFIGEYLPLSQFIILGSSWGLIFYILNQIFDISLVNFIVFWILPLLLSSIQLFYFGTYLPHGGNEKDSSNSHHAHSTNYPIFWSFLTCYHFGYHWEHHEYPNIPWYRLPEIRFQQNLKV